MIVGFEKPNGSPRKSPRKKAKNGLLGQKLRWSLTLAGITLGVLIFWMGLTVSTESTLFFDSRSKGIVYGREERKSHQEREVYVSKDGETMPLDSFSYATENDGATVDELDAKRQVKNINGYGNVESENGQPMIENKEPLSESKEHSSTLKWDQEQDQNPVSGTIQSLIDGEQEDEVSGEFHQLSNDGRSKNIVESELKTNLAEISVYDEQKTMKKETDTRLDLNTSEADPTSSHVMTKLNDDGSIISSHDVVVQGEIQESLEIEDVRNRKIKFATLPRTLNTDYNLLDPTKRYFLYSPSGGFNNQLICLVNAIKVARELKRDLIVPMTSKHANLFNGYLNVRRRELIETDMVLNMAYLQNFTGVNFVLLNTTLLEFLENIKDSVSIRTLKMPKEGLMKPNDPSIFNRLMSASKASKLDLVYWRGRFYSQHWLNRTIWSHARYSDYLQDFAKIVHHDLLGGKHFNSMHIRLGDYENTSSKHSPDASGYVADAIVFGFEKHIPLYVASDEDRDHPYFKPLFDYFDHVFFLKDLVKNPVTKQWLIDYTLRTPKADVRNDILGLVEQLICTRSTKFLGTHVSTFSLTIKIMRKKISGSIPSFFDELKEDGMVRRTGSHTWTGQSTVTNDMIK